MYATIEYIQKSKHIQLKTVCILKEEFLTF